MEMEIPSNGRLICEIMMKLSYEVDNLEDNSPQLWLRATARRGIHSRLLSAPDAAAFMHRSPRKDRPYQ